MPTDTTTLERRAIEFAKLGNFGTDALEVNRALTEAAPSNQGAWTRLALGIWLVLAGYWLLVQIYWFPIILEMENDRVLLGLRNALVLVILSPGFSIVTGLLMLLLLVVGTLLTVPAILLLASLLLLMANHATRSRLARVRKKPYRPGLDED